MGNIAIEIGGTKLQIAIGDSKTGVLGHIHRFYVDKEQGAKGILDKIEETLNSFQEPIETIGVGFGGPVNIKTGIIAASHQIGGWSGMDLKNWFQTRYQVSVFIENDANTAALGEAHFGAGKGYEHVFYVTLGSGVGGGMVVNGQLYHGNIPGEAEIGLMAMDNTGRTLESCCSGWALDKIIKDKVKNPSNRSILKKLVGINTTGEARFLAPALQQKDRTAVKIFEEYTDFLAWGLSHVVHLFNPQVIVLGGGVSLMGEILVHGVSKVLPQYIYKTFQPVPKICLAALKEEAVLVGALCLNKIFITQN